VWCTGRKNRIAPLPLKHCGAKCEVVRGPWSVRSRKLSNVGQSLDGWPKTNYLELHRASEGILSRWSRLYLQSLAPTNLQWTRVVGYGLLSFWVIHKACTSAVGTLIGWWWWCGATPHRTVTAPCSLARIEDFSCGVRDRTMMAMGLPPVTFASVMFS
jgi:hypothetical protein